MTTGFPQYSNAAKLGDLGVSVVSKIISDRFGWLFKRNHQEHDFGIDGQVEFVTPDGAVTGQMFAVQVKCGRSFLKEKNKWGFVYRGEQKHFNYLVNYPVPVVICLCDPDSSECFWVQFRTAATDSTGQGWRITVPFENKLAEARDSLEALVGPLRDGLGELKAYWALNRMIVESAVVFYALDEHDVVLQEVAIPRAFFDRLRCSKELASECQGKVEIMFSGYDDDPRELYEIPEVREYVSKLDRALPDLFFFVRCEQPSFTLVTFALCHTEVHWLDGRSTKEMTRQVTYDTPPVADFIERHCPGLNELTEWVGMSAQDEERLFFKLLKCLGLQMPNGEHEA